MPWTKILPTEPDPGILVVDDDNFSVLAVRRVMEKLQVTVPIRVATDGLHALEILRGEAGEARMAPPYLVLLDINMPRMNGHEFLDTVRSDPALHRTIVFVLTTSDAAVDIDRAYDRNVAGYLLKDDLSEALMKNLKLINCFSKAVSFPLDQD